MKKLVTLLALLSFVAATSIICAQESVEKKTSSSQQAAVTPAKPATPATVSTTEAAKSVKKVKKVKKGVKKSVEKKEGTNVEKKTESTTPATK